MAETKLFKIRAADGTFSTGGRYPNFTKSGKTWSSMAFLKAHIRETGSDTLKKYVMKGCMVIEYVTVEASETSIDDILDEVIQRKRELEKEQADSHARWKQKQEIEQLKNLQRKYPNV